MAEKNAPRVLPIDDEHFIYSLFCKAALSCKILNASIKHNIGEKQ
jgi:hypothetical protein